MPVKALVSDRETSGEVVSTTGMTEAIKKQLLIKVMQTKF